MDMAMIVVIGGQHPTGRVWCLGHGTLPVPFNEVVHGASQTLGVAVPAIFSATFRHKVELCFPLEVRRTSDKT